MEDREIDTSFTVADLQGLLFVMVGVVPAVPKEGDYLTRYLILMSNYIRELSESFVVLVQTGSLKASAVVARTILESAIRLRASSRNPDACLQIACSEIDEHVKWLDLLNGDPEEKKQSLEEFRLFREELISQFVTEHSCSDSPKGIHIETLFQTKRADLPSVYNAQYRYLSRFTHGNALAANGDLGEIDITTTVVCCVRIALEELERRGVIPNLETLVSDQT